MRFLYPKDNPSTGCIFLFKDRLRLVLKKDKRLIFKAKVYLYSQLFLSLLPNTHTTLQVKSLGFAEYNPLESTNWSKPPAKEERKPTKKF